MGKDECVCRCVCCVCVWGGGRGGEDELCVCDPRDECVYYIVYVGG